MVDYPYFETAEPVAWEDDTTYVETDVVFKVNLTHSWNHGLGEIITALMDAGLTITAFEEHDSVPWEALPGQMERIGGGEYRLADRPWRLPALVHPPSGQAHLAGQAEPAVIMKLAVGGGQGRRCLGWLCCQVRARSGEERRVTREVAPGSAPRVGCGIPDRGIPGAPC